MRKYVLIKFNLQNGQIFERSISNSKSMRNQKCVYVYFIIMIDSEI